MIDNRTNEPTDEDREHGFTAGQLTQRAIRAALAAAGVAPQSATLAVESLQCDSQCDFQCDSVIDETALADEFARHGHVMVAPGPHECSCGATLEWVEGGYSRAFKLHQARAVAAWLKDGGAR